MTEIYNDQTNFATSRGYANVQNDLQKFRQEHYAVGSTNSTLEQGAASSASILTVAPTPSQLDVLTGALVKTSWSWIQRPPDFGQQRPISPYFVPSLGSPDNQETDIKKITAAMQGGNHAEGQVVLNLLTELKTTNLNVDDVRGRMNQFKQV